MDESSKLRRSDNVTFEIVADEAILVDINTGAYYSLNEVGTYFWNAIDGERTVEEIAAEIAETYNEKASDFVEELSELAKLAEVDVDEEQIEYLADTYDVDADLVTESLVELREGDSVATEAVLIQDLSVDAETVLDDLLELIETMADDGLLVEVDGE